MTKQLKILSCDGCGACCTEQAALPIHLASDSDTFRLEGVNPLPDMLRLELVTLRKAFLRNGFPPDGSPCIWYDSATRKCKHYEYRPTLCRDGVRVGDAACRRWRKAKGIH